ncbi:MAG: hypothetical protein ABI183_24060 [Polyangiaceae bacterium]
MTRSALTSIGGLIALAGCSTILSIEPTQVTSGDGGANNIVNNGPTPPFSSDCASAINSIDPNGDEANAIAADDNGVFWAAPRDASTSQVFALVGGVQSTVSRYNPNDSTESEPTVLGLALDSTHLYWASWDTYNGANGTAHLREWSRTDGTIVEADLSAAGTGVSEITIASGNQKLFYANWRTQGQHANLLSIKVPFTAGQKPFIESGGEQSPLHFASDSDAVYFDEATDDLENPDELSLASATLGGANEIEVSAHDIEDLVVGASSRVYWAQTSDNEIQMHTVDRAAKTETFTTAIPYPQLLAYDGDHQMLYVISVSTSNVWSLQRISTTDANPQPVMCVDNLTDSSALQYWNGHVYFSGVSKSASGLFDLTIK